MLCKIVASVLLMYHFLFLALSGGEADVRNRVASYWQPAIEQDPQPDKPQALGPADKPVSLETGPS